MIYALIAGRELAIGSDDWVFAPSQRPNARTVRLPGGADSIEKMREISIWT